MAMTLSRPLLTARRIATLNRKKRWQINLGQSLRKHCPAELFSTIHGVFAERFVLSWAVCLSWTGRVEKICQKSGASNRNDIATLRCDSDILLTMRLVCH